MINSFQNRVGQWAEKTFPKATNKTIIAHMKREIKELESARSVWDVGEECADIYHMLLHIAHKNRFNLAMFAKNKFEINQKRKWGKPDHEGVVEHIKEQR